MNNKKSVIVLLLIAIIGIVGLTIAYFTNSTDVENIFKTKEYGTEYTETFVSPDNWLPGDTTQKTVVAENTGEIDQAVRIHITEEWKTHNNGTLNGWIHADGTKSEHESESELANDERVAVLNLINKDEWTQVGDYYYYKYKLAPNEKTSSFLESVTFNPKTKLDDTCQETSNANGVKTITCNSSGDDYDNATYTLNLTIETVQYNKYANSWNTNITIAEEKPGPIAQELIKTSNNNPTNYSSGDIHQMYKFSHEATSQTGALDDYRYIGNDPYNYVYFNCTDESNTSTCEIWRIIGVFTVGRPDPDNAGETITEQRIKLIRGKSLSSSVIWADGDYNNWNVSNMKNYLNTTYYNSLKDSAKSKIDTSRYYIGQIDSNTITSSDYYNAERGNNVLSGFPTNWDGKIGLMYASDYIFTFGYGVQNTCFNNIGVCYNTGGGTGEPRTSWIYNSDIRDGQSNVSNYTYTITTGLISDFAYSIDLSGNLFSARTGYFIGEFATRPVVYLNADVKLKSGTGTSTDPYTLK